jgi:hypothetical protein
MKRLINPWLIVGLFVGAILGCIFFLGSSIDCDNRELETKLLQTSSKDTTIDGCEYLRYPVKMLCGHQYTHHVYETTFLLHKGNCRNHDKKN